MGVTNQRICQMLHELAVLTELEEGTNNSFRVRAYTNAERAISGLHADVAEMTDEELTGVRGVGKGIAGKIREFLETGSLGALEELREKHPPGERELLRIPGIGPKTVALLKEELGVRDVDGLREALEAHHLRDVKGLGARTEDNIREALERMAPAGEERRVPVAEALPLAEGIVAELSQVRGVEGVVYAGSLRRLKETVGDLDILAATHDPGPVMEAFVGLSVVKEVKARGTTKATVRTARDLQVDLRVVDPANIGAALAYFTGSKAHNIRMRERAVRRGLTLNEYALARADSGEVVASRTEEEIYKALDLAHIPPEMREDTGEIEAAEEGELPDCAEVGDLRGDLHDHTTWSGDGRMSLEALVEAAAGRGYRYLAVTDHAENLRVNGVSRQGMLEQRERLEDLAGRRPELHLLHGSELNIGPEGDLDYDEDFLRGFDWCVASVHSHFRLDPDQQTERLIAALRHPAVHAIGHLTGRIIGRRPGIELNLDRVLEVAAETGTAIEINASLERLDAAADVLRRAVEAGCVMTISTDAHALPHLDNVSHGVRQARRGWVPRDRVVNTWDADRFLAWARAKPDRVS